MELDCGRMGSVYGTFCCDKEDIKKLFESRIYFGEILGKHSEITADLSEDEIFMVTDDPAAVELFEKYKFQSGYNPFHYIQEDEDV